MTAVQCKHHAASALKHACFWLAGVTTERELLSEGNTIHPEIYTDQLPDLLSVKAAQPA